MVDRVLREADILGQVAATVDTLTIPEPDRLAAAVTDYVDRNETEPWVAGVSEIVREIAGPRTSDADQRIS